MELKDLCVSLETAKKLVEAGIKIDSIFWWYEQYHNDILKKTFIHTNYEPENRYGWSYKKYPAPTAGEIELISVIVNGIKYIAYIFIPHEPIQSTPNIWCVYSANSKIEISDCLVWDSNERECELKANMLLWLQE